MRGIEVKGIGTGVGKNTYASISQVVDGAGIEACALERASHAGRAKITLHSCVEAAVEVELKSVAHIGSRGVRREDESSLTDVDLDYFRDCTARHQGQDTESNG